MGTKEFSRTRRVSEQVRRDLAEVLSREVADPRFQRITLTSVKVSHDLSHAKVYFTLPKDEDKEQTSKALRHASGYLRGLLADRLTLRITPKLSFLYDESLDQALRISELLDMASHRKPEQD